MPCSDSLAWDNHARIHEANQQRDRADQLARIACAFGQALEKHFGDISSFPGEFGHALRSADLPEDRVLEAMDWWRQHKREDARKAAMALRTMKIRLHRGSLTESVRTAEQIEPTEQAIREYLTRQTVLITNEQASVRVVLYSDAPDQRVGWKSTWLVLVNELPIAMVDGPLES